MQTIKKLRVYDQRLDETGVKVISGFEEYWTVIILFDRGVSRKMRFREMDEAPRLLSFSTCFKVSRNKNELKETSTYEHRFYYMAQRLIPTDTYQRPTT